MSDLFLGMAIMMGLALLLAGGTWLATARAPKWVLDLLAAGVIAGMVAFLVLLRDDVVMAKWLPYSNLVIVGNWLPLFAGMLAGLLVRRIRGRPTSQFLWATLLLVTAGFAVVTPFRGSAPSCNNRWETFCRGCAGIGGHDRELEFCFQTSEVTCSPAAACTLLADHGIDCNEDDLAEMSLTRDSSTWAGGTTWQGLFRGLKLATEGTEWTVEVFDCDYDTLVAMPGPKLLFVELIPGSGYDPIYVTRYGWTPGRRHTIVFYEPLTEGAGRDEGRVVVGDPSVGLEEWSRRDMDTLWHGRGMRLVRRAGSGSPDGEPA